MKDILRHNADTLLSEPIYRHGPTVLPANDKLTIGATTDLQQKGHAINARLASAVFAHRNGRSRLMFPWCCDHDRPTGMGFGPVRHE